MHIADTATYQLGKLGAKIKNYDPIAHLSSYASNSSVNSILPSSIEEIETSE